MSDVLRRNRSIRSAVSTSLASKGSSAMLQFISLPLAARVLGREEFGIYATVSLAVFAVAMLQLGVGPALSRGIALASAENDHEKEGRLYRGGILLVAVFALLGLVLVAILLKTVPIPVLFGDEFAPFVEPMRSALWTGAFLMTAHLLAASTDRVREGYMEAGIVNAWSAAGNLGGAIMVFTGISVFPSITFLLLAVFGPNLVARILSTGTLLKKRPWLVRGKARPDRATFLELIRDGISFSATSFLVYLVEYVVCALVIGRLRGPGDVAIFHVLMSVTTAFTGLLMMVGTPLWAAIVDARTKGDSDWMRSATRRYYQYLAAMCLAAAIGLIGLGPWLVPRLYGAEFTVDRLLFVGHAAFLCSIGWRAVNRYLAIGFGLLPRTVGPILIGLLSGLALGVPGLEHWGLPALFFGMATGTLLIPGGILPRLVGRELCRSENDVREGGAQPNQALEAASPS